MFLTNLFFKKSCRHDKISPEAEFGYCPDCGKLIQNEWYITRCACCKVKLKAIIKNGEIEPQNHFCINCGAHDYVMEKVNKISFIDINFAVLVKKEAPTPYRPASTCRCWQEKTAEKPKMLVQYL